MSTIKATDVVKYVAAPEIIPRIQKLFASGFGMIPFLIAQVYAMVRIIPSNHVYLNPANIGRFGVRHVIAEAADHIEITKKNWDQILIFTVILSGMVMFVAQIGLAVVSVVFDPVWAAPVTNSIFVTPYQYTSGNVGNVGNVDSLNDMAYILLDRVFGVPGFFCSFDGTTNICTDVFETQKADARWPFHIALQSMFQFYSMGLLIVATLIFLYFIVVVVAETATSGSPFGERFQNPWIPIRLVVALLLLTPMTYGYNIGQYLVLFTAKIGSSFATNGWNRFNETLRTSQGENMYTANGENMSTLVGLPPTPDFTPLIQSMALVHGCAIGLWKEDNTYNATKTHKKYGIDNTITDLSTSNVVPPYDGTVGEEDTGFYIRPYAFRTGQAGNSSENYMEIKSDTSFYDLLKFYNFGNVVIRFGKLNAALKKVESKCGDFEISVLDRSYLSDINDPTAEDSTDNIGTYNTYLSGHGGGAFMHDMYYSLLMSMWFGGDSWLIPIAQRVVLKELVGGSNMPYQCKVGCDAMYDGVLPSCTDKNALGQLRCKVEDVNPLVMQEVFKVYQPSVKALIESARDLMVSNNSSVAMSDDILKRGWGGAALWYNKIGAINGDFSTAVSSVPTMIKFPAIMEEVKALRLKKDADVSGWAAYSTKTSEGKNIDKEIQEEGSREFADAMYKLLTFLLQNKDTYRSAKGDGTVATPKKTDGNVIKTAMNFVLGTSGVFDMKDAINRGIHPIAQLALIGRGMIDATIRNLAISTGLSIAGGVQGLFGDWGASAVEIGTSLFSTTAFIGLTAGVTLYYIVPILPFVFFFFALAGWVKGIFEAMVGVPLWALAHMRLGGEGLPGEAASSGYFLLLEIFVRPILIVFGLIASSLIFSMEVRLLNIIWDVVISNVGGSAGNILDVSTSPVDGDFNQFIISRSEVDQFFYTIIFTMVVYMMATSSFKLIDSVPDSIMRWSGQDVKSFGDGDKNPSAGLTQYAVTGGMIQGQKLMKSGQTAITGLGKLVTGGGQSAAPKKQ